MALVGEAAKNIAAINALAADGGPVDDMGQIFRRINRGRVRPGEIWEGLSPAARNLLGLEFVGGAVMRIARNAELVKSEILHQLAGDRVRPQVDERRAKYRLVGCPGPVKAARLAGFVGEAPSPIARAEVVVRCVAATSAPLHAVEHVGNSWASLAATAAETDVAGMHATLGEQGFELNGGGGGLYEFKIDEDNPAVAMLCVSTPLLSGQRTVTLGEWKGNATHPGLQEVGVSAEDYFSVDVDELTGYLGDAKLQVGGRLSEGAAAVLREALSAQEDTLVTPLASMVTISQEVSKM